MLGAGGVRIPAPVGYAATSHLFFFEQCCARHYNCGSHEAVLK